jgi:hypothetical protein
MNIELRLAHLHIQSWAEKTMKETRREGFAYKSSLFSTITKAYMYQHIDLVVDYEEIELAVNSLPSKEHIDVIKSKYFYHNMNDKERCQALSRAWGRSVTPSKFNSLLTCARWHIGGYIAAMQKQLKQLNQ